MVSLAGCTTPGEADADSDSPMPIPDGLGLDSYAVSFTAPGNVSVGEALAYTLEVEGDIEYESGHFGAHYWLSSTNEPTRDLSAAGACAHAKEVAAMPGVFRMTCTFSNPGEYFIRGHLRVVGEDGNLDYWSEEYIVEVEDI